MITELEITKKLQQIELKMLHIFIQICEKEHLKYYLIGGTLLGAVRHKGFIPWDDDIDVGMPREDYDKFMLCAEKYLPKEYFLQTYHTDKEYPFPFAKIRNLTTIYKENQLKNLNICHGVWMDIFPLDYCPNNYFFINICQRILLKRTSCRFCNKTTFKQKLYKLFSLVICPSWRKAVIRRDALIRSGEKNSPLIANFCGAWGAKEIVPTEWYGEGASLTFEHLTVKGPLEYHKWLTQVYGDYMQLPPIEKRKCHHPAEIKL